MSGFVEGFGSLLTRFSTLPLLLRLLQSAQQAPAVALQGAIAEQTRRRLRTQAPAAELEAQMFPPLERPPVIRPSAQRQQMDQIAQDLKRTDVETFHRAVAQAAEQLGLPADVKAWEQITTAMQDQLRTLQAEVAAAGRSRAERTQILETERQLQQLRAQGVREADLTPQMRTEIQAYAAEVARLQEQLRGLRDPLQEFLKASESGWVKLQQGP